MNAFTNVIILVASRREKASLLRGWLFVRTDSGSISHHSFIGS
jgi:hypothetical protein